LREGRERKTKEIRKKKNLGWGLNNFRKCYALEAQIKKCSNFGIHFVFSFSRSSRNLSALRVQKFCPRIWHLTRDNYETNHRHR
jgi:hypothetical protein